MTWDKENIEPQRWTQFLFFSSGGADGFVNESIIPGTDFGSIPWKLGEVRLHFSVAFASVEDFVIRISSIKGSAYNTLLISQALNGITDMTIHYSDPLLFLSDDQLVITGAMVSATNIYGMEFIGWAAMG